MRAQLTIRHSSFIEAWGMRTIYGIVGHLELDESWGTPYQRYQFAEVKKTLAYFAGKELPGEPTADQ
jgi:hypothetical protein